MKKSKSEQLQLARVLGGFTLDGVAYGSNDIIEAHPQIIKSLGTAVDTDYDAIEQCVNVEGSVIKRHDPATDVSKETKSVQENQ